ncbi:MAG: protein kinase domain-containing protein, partial [Nannocystaceae bacterium]
GPGVDPLLNTLLDDRYRVEKLLARGGVGVVYAAEDIEEKGGRNARVVIKVLSPERVGDSQAEGRFERESKRLNQLFHPNIVRLIATGREPRGRAFMVMEYVDGETLEAYLATRKRLDIEDFAPIAAQILKAIGYAHSQGMVHRDLKPANIMLCTRNGRANVVKILDFGLARLIEGDQQITTDQVVGTAGFLAPEQFDGRPIDQRVDVYALGILFYTMLAGRQPFVADTGAALMYKHLHEAPEPLGQALPPTHGVPDGVISLVMQALSKEPQARPESANELTERLFECVHATMFQLPVAPAAASLAKQLANIPIPQPQAARSAAQIPTTPVMTVTADDGLELLDETGAHMSAKRESTAVRSGVYRTLRSGTHRRVRSSGVRSQSAASLSQPSRATTRRISRVGTGFEAMVAPKRQSDPRTWILAVLVPLLLVMSVVYWYQSREAPAGQQSMVVADALDRVDRLIVSGEFEAAHDALASLTDRVEQSNLLRNRHEQLAEELELARLVKRARQFEDADKLEEARSVYRDVLSRDNNHPVARERLLELNALIAPVEEGAEQGSLLISSRPKAELQIDGQRAGPTPFLGNLEVGEHTLSISLDGYAPWARTVEVETGENPSISVRLEAKREVARESTVRGSRGAADTPKPEQPKSSKRKKAKVFLPSGPRPPAPAEGETKADVPVKKSKGIFLPTGEK